MNKKYISQNFGRFFLVYIICSIINFVGSIAFTSLENGVILGLFLAVLCIIFPALFGRILLKRTDNIMQDAISVFIPSVIIYFISFIGFFCFTKVIYNYSVAMVLCVLNYPTYIMTAYLPEELANKVIWFIVPLMAFITAVFAFIGLCTKKRKPEKESEQVTE